MRTPRGGFGSSELLWDAALLDRLAALRQPRPDPALLAEVGQILRDFIAPTGWELLEQQISTAVQQGEAVCVTVRSAAAELYALPWELLTLRASGQTLGGMPGVLVRYEWPETATARASAEQRPGRVLMAWSAAGGAVPAAEHVAALRAAGGGLPFDAASDVLAHASATSLVAELARREREGTPITALHLLCHGGMSGPVFGLVLDGEAADDPPALLDPARLQQILASHARTLRLVVLAACDSGNQGDFGGRIGSAAQMLHRAGLAAVVASRYPFSVAGSVRMTDALYRGLGEGTSLEQAFIRARTALAGDITSLDWASIQLYARAADGPATHLFARTGAAPSVSPVAPARTRRWPLAAGGALGVIGLVAWSIGGFGRGERPGDTPRPPETPPVDAKDTKAAVDLPPDTPGKVDPLPSTTGKVDPPPGTTGKVDPPPNTTGKVDPKPKRDPPPVDCDPDLKSLLRAKLPTRESPAQLTLQVSSKGKATATSADADAAEDASKILARVDADTVKEKADGKLPCFFPHEW